MAVKTGTEIKVGIFVFIALAALAVMSLQVGSGSGSWFGGGTYDLVVVFDSVTGLKQGAPVEVAGIEIGTVREIGLEGDKARLTLAIKDDVKLRSNVIASIKSRGVLGDKFVQLHSGSGEADYLAEGDRIQRSDRSADLEVLFEKVGQIADDIGLVAKSVANVMGGPEGERDLKLTFYSLRDLAVNLNEMVKTNMESVNLIVENMKNFSGDMAQVSSENKKSLGVIIQNFEVASTQLRGTLDKMGGVLDKIDSGEGAMGKMVSDREMGEDLKRTVASLESVARKIDEGKGTLGKLVNDETTGEQLDQALEGVNKYLAKQDDFKTVLDFHAEHQAESGDFKSTLNMELHPSSDHFYILGVVSDPQGRTKETETVTQTWNGSSYSSVRQLEEKTERDQLLFNAQIGKRWGDLALRGGVFESTGGVGADYYLWDDRIKVFAEAFDFDADDPAHYKAGLNLYFMKNFYVAAGWDDFASTAGNSSFFAGLGLRFTDEDLKYLMSSVPVPAGN